MDVRHPQPQVLKARLGLWDTTSILVGIIVGVGIYQAPASVFKDSGGPWEALGLWLVGGLLSLLGAFCFAELGSTYPRSGGEYVYLTRAYGSWAGFLFGWAQLAVIRTGGSIAVVAYGCAEYGGKLLGPQGETPASYAALAIAIIVVLTAVNILGVSLGKGTQNLLTVLKVVGLAGILLAGFLCAQPSDALEVTAPAKSSSPVSFASLAAGLVLVLWTYAGWQEAGYIAAEVRDRRRTLPLALILGTSVVTVLYLLVNTAYLAALGFENASRSKAVAADLLGLALGDWGASVMSLLVVLSCLGAINGMIFTSSRIFAEMGTDHKLFAALGKWDPQLGTPVRSLLAQAAVSVGMVLVVSVLWKGMSGFDALVACTAAVFWLFFLFTGVAVFVLRVKDRDAVRPFRVPGYPLTPLLFCLCCGGMVCGSIAAAPQESLLGLGLLVSGVPLYFLSRGLDGRDRQDEQPQPAPFLPEKVKVG